LLLDDAAAEEEAYSLLSPVLAGRSSISITSTSGSSSLLVVIRLTGFLPARAAAAVVPDSDIGGRCGGCGGCDGFRGDGFGGHCGGGGRGSTSGIGHMCIVMCQPGCMILSQTCGNMMSPFGPTMS